MTRPRVRHDRAASASPVGVSSVAGVQQLPADAGPAAFVVPPDNRPWVNVALFLLAVALLCSCLVAIFSDEAFVVVKEYSDGVRTRQLPDVLAPLLIWAMVFVLGFLVWLFQPRWTCLDGPRVWSRRRWSSWTPGVDTGDVLMIDVHVPSANAWGAGVAFMFARLLVPLAHAAMRRTGSKPTRSTAIRPVELVLVQNAVGQSYSPRRSGRGGLTDEQLAALKKQRPLRALVVPLAGYSPKTSRSLLGDHIATHLVSGNYMVSEFARGVMFEHGIHLSATGTVQPVA